MLSSGGGVQRQFGVQEVDTGKLVATQLAQIIRALAAEM
jgi:hypothetical protein